MVGTDIIKVKKLSVKIIFRFMIFKKSEHGNAKSSRDNVGKITSRNCFQSDICKVQDKLPKREKHKKRHCS